MAMTEGQTTRGGDSAIAPLPAPSKRRTAARPSLLRFAWVTVPVHVAFGFWFSRILNSDPDELAAMLLWIHLGFPVLMAICLRLWWDRWGELVALLIINHAATFAVLLWQFSAVA